MARPINATVYLCYPPLNGTKTSMDRLAGMFMRDKDGKIYIKEKAGKRKWDYNSKYLWKTMYKGRLEFLCFYDHDTNFQLNPTELMKGESFSRAEIKNAITNQLNAERRAKAAMGIQAQNKLTTLVGLMFVIASLMMLVSTAMYANAMTNVHVTVSIGNRTNSSSPSILGTLGAAASGAGKAMGSIP